MIYSKIFKIVFPKFLSRYQHERTLQRKIIDDLQHQEFINTILVSDNFCSSQSGYAIKIFTLYSKCIHVISIALCIQ
ncbi:hypothetical protein Hanom_Chr04g00294551 [Helianthus anomalus]